MQDQNSVVQVLLTGFGIALFLKLVVWLYSVSVTAPPWASPASPVPSAAPFQTRPFITSPPPPLATPTR